MAVELPVQIRSAVRSVVDMGIYLMGELMKAPPAAETTSNSAEASSLVQLGVIV